MTDIESQYAASYSLGKTAIDVAAQVVAIQLDTRDDIRRTRAHDPDAYPGFRGSLTVDAAALRIVGELLNAGWSPPTDDAIRKAVERSRARVRDLAERLKRGEVPEHLVESCGPEMFATQAQRDRLADSMLADLRDEESA